MPLKRRFTGYNSKFLNKINKKQCTRNNQKFICLYKDCKRKIGRNGAYNNGTWDFESGVKIDRIIKHVTAHLCPNLDDRENFIIENRDKILGYAVEVPEYITLDMCREEIEKIYKTEEAIELEGLKR
jgi:hypothetical protein